MTHLQINVTSSPEVNRAERQDARIVYEDSGTLEDKLTLGMLESIKRFYLGRIEA